MAETILRMTGIQKYFPGVHALDNAQLEVREGEVMALVGENGAGKSTLMKICSVWTMAGSTAARSNSLESMSRSTARATRRRSASASSIRS